MRGVSPSTGSRPRYRRSGGPPPDRIDALLNAAAAHYAAGRLDAASEVYRTVEAQDAEDTRARYSLAVIDLRRSRFGEARRRLRAVLRRRADHFEAFHNLGVAEQALGGWEAAAEAYARALALRPQAAETAFARAVALAVLGRADEAIRLYRTLAAEPASRAAALTRLAMLRPSAISEAELTSLRADAVEGALPPQDRVGALFALGQALEARGADAAAWEALEAGNVLKRQLLSAGEAVGRPEVVARENARSIERIKALFTPAFLSRCAGQGDRVTRPIFIVGMPRSGSSLVEQSLSSHPQVQGMGESGVLWGALGGRFPYPPDAPRESDHFRELARRYLAAQRARGWTDRLRPADKTLDSHLHVGMLHLMFPKATILHVVRDPVDTGLACWRQLFAHGNETLYDLAEIGAEQRRYAEMMEHWAHVLPGRVIDVSYEALTADPEGQIRWMVTEVCGLPWASECLRFHLTRTAVATASAEQVRQPIYRTSVERWRRYEPQLKPLLTALGRTTG